jgi:hypothetical protein
MTPRKQRRIQIFSIVSLLLLAVSQAFVARVFDLPWAYATTAIATVAALIGARRLRAARAPDDGNGEGGR